MTTKIDTSDKASTLAVSLENEFRAPLRALAEKKGCAEAHLARLAIRAMLVSEGYKVADVVESKKGPKSGAKLHPLAEKFGLSNAELNRRISVLTKQGMSLNKVAQYDFAIDPAPVKHREPKAPTAPTA